MQLLRFHDNTMRLIGAWFGDGQMDGAAETVSGFVLSSGSWGEAGSGLISQSVKDMKHTAPGVSGRMRYIWKNLFPGIEILRKQYPVLDRAPWLLPGVWLIRPFQKLLFERQKLKTHGRNLDLLSRDNLDARRLLFRTVGLDYNF